MLNAEQKQAAHYEGQAKNVLILAGAGTGKTTTLVERVKYLVKKGLKPSQILCVTFTNRAAREMKQRIRKTLGAKAEDLKIKTFHAYVLSVLIEFPQFFKEKRHTIIDDQDQKSLMKVVIAKYAAEHDHKAETLPPADLILKGWSYCKNTCTALSDYLKTLSIDDKGRGLIQEIVSAFESHKKSRGYIDFDDLLIMFCAEIKRNPEFRDAMNKQFAEILVDEFQDANPIQFFFLKLMTMRETRLFCVGDDAQSIYGFRGADFHLVHSFKDKFPNSITFKLVTNYRSHQESLDLANWLLNKSTLSYGKDLVSGKGEGGNKPILMDFQSPLSEAMWVSTCIRDLIDEGADPGEIMILLRSSFDGMHIRKALADLDIRYQVIGGDNLYKTAHIKDLISVLRITTNHDDEIAWMRFLTLWKGVGSSKANKTIPMIMACKGNKQAITSTLHEVFGARHSVTQIYSELLKLKNAPSRALSLVADYMPEIIQIKRYDKNRERIHDVKALCEYAASFSSLDDLLDDIALEPATFSQLANKHKRNTVTLITIHSAKGTEANYCFMPHVKDGVYPNKRSKGSVEAEEEERRVAYVAVTRVKEQLYLSRINDIKGDWNDADVKAAKTEEFFFQKIPSTLTRLIAKSDIIINKQISIGENDETIP
ncbi:ATP-dependent helicase [Pseudomonas luteola]